MTDGTGTTSYSYNAITGTATLGAGRLASVSVPIAGSSATVAYSYDAVGRVTSRTVDGMRKGDRHLFGSCPLFPHHLDAEHSLPGRRLLSFLPRQPKVSISGRSDLGLTRFRDKPEVVPPWKTKIVAFPRNLPHHR